MTITFYRIISCARNKITSRGKSQDQPQAGRHPALGQTNYVLLVAAGALTIAVTQRTSRLASRLEAPEAIVARIGPSRLNSSSAVARELCASSALHSPPAGLETNALLNTHIADDFQHNARAFGSRIRGTLPVDV